VLSLELDLDGRFALAFAQLRASRSASARPVHQLRANARSACAFVRIGACGSLAPSRASSGADRDVGAEIAACAFAQEQEPGGPPPDDRSITNPIVPEPRAG
jgi:hypothetical protein